MQLCTVNTQASVHSKPAKAIQLCVLFVCWNCGIALLACTDYRRQEAHQPPLPLMLPAEMEADTDLVTSEDGSPHSIQHNNMQWQQPLVDQQQQQLPPPPQQQCRPDHGLQNWQHQAPQPFLYMASPTRQHGPPCGGSVARGGARKLSSFRSRSTGATRMLSTAAAGAVNAHQVR